VRERERERERESNYYHKIQHAIGHLTAVGVNASEKKKEIN
jgi:hypothetical protein